MGVVGDVARGGEADLARWVSLATWHAVGDVDLASGSYHLYHINLDQSRTCSSLYP